MDKRTFHIELEGITLRGKVYVPECKPAPALCLCHGMPRGGPPDPSDPGYPALADRFSQAGFLITFFNFRGTGASEGNLDIAGWTRDLEAVLDYIYTMDEVDRDKISVMGFSAGAAVSIYVTAHDLKVSSLIACACPVQSRLATDRELAESVISDFRNIGTIKDPGFPPSLEEWMDGFKQIYPLNWIDKICPRPLLIIQGTADDVVDPAGAWALYKRAGEPKDIITVEGAGHRLRLDRQAMDGALDWLTTRVSSPFRD